MKISKKVLSTTLATLLASSTFTPCTAFKNPFASKNSTATKIMDTKLFEGICKTSCVIFAFTTHCWAFLVLLFGALKNAGRKLRSREKVWLFAIGGIPLVTSWYLTYKCIKRFPKSKRGLLITCILLPMLM